MPSLAHMVPAHMVPAHVVPATSAAQRPSRLAVSGPALGTGVTLIGPALLGAFLLSGCAAIDPYQRAGNWRPNHANDTNLALMVAVPSDLARGVADDYRGNGQNAATAVYRQQAEEAYRLPDSAVSRVVPVGTGTGAAGNAGPSNGQSSGGASQ